MIHGAVGVKGPKEGCSVPDESEIIRIFSEGYNCKGRFMETENAARSSAFGRTRPVAGHHRARSMP